MSTLKLSFLVSVLICATFVACKKENNHSPRTFYRQVVPLGADSARSFVTLDTNNEPLTLGIQLGENAINNLPKSGDTYLLPKPSHAKVIGIDHIEADWNHSAYQPI